DAYGAAPPFVARHQPSTDAYGAAPPFVARHQPSTDAYGAAPPSRRAASTERVLTPTPTPCPKTQPPSPEEVRS
ncbi:hypothetical protein, partial [Nocardiopsis nanhaiensis]